MSAPLRLGIIGGGQLGRMLALAAAPLGIRTTVLEPVRNSPAATVARQIIGNYDDPAALAELAAASDVVTYEFENISATAAQTLTARVPVFPPPAALIVTQDRVIEKTFFGTHGIPTAPWAAADSYAALRDAAAQLGYPLIAKTRTLGYDGRGQQHITAASDLEIAWRALGGVPLIVEAVVPFVRELSIIAARGRDGTLLHYPLIANTHRAGILRRSVVPAPDPDPTTQATAEAYIARLMTTIGYVGVFTIELFELASGQLLANEAAPRVHNSGHWTIEGAETSQFANHVRAVLGLPLGATTLRYGAAGLINLVGAVPVREDVLRIAGAALHLYDKTARPGRKLGHVTVIARDHAQLMMRMAMVERLTGTD